MQNNPNTPTNPMRAYTKLCALVDNPRNKGLVATEEYERVHAGNHYPLDTFAGHNARGMRIKKGEKSRFFNEHGAALFTSSQLYNPAYSGKDAVAEINCPHKDVI